MQAPFLKQKHFLSFLCVFAFAILALGSKVNKLHHNAFVYDYPNEEESKGGNFIVKNDGSKIYGKDIAYHKPLLKKGTITIDDQKFDADEIKGYRRGNTYYLRHKNMFLQRIIHGKANLYVYFSSSYDEDLQGFTRNYTRTDHWGQIGEDGPLVVIAGRKEIRKLLADCPISVQMASLSNSKIRKELKINPGYLNKIFDVYNNGCKDK